MRVESFIMLYLAVEFYFLRWMCSVASLVDGLIGTLSLGFLNPNCSLSAQAHFLDHCEWNFKLKEQNANDSKTDHENNQEENGECS